MVEFAILPLCIVFGIGVWTLVAVWYVKPALAGRTLEAALTPLLLFHGFRYIGLTFLVEGVVGPQMVWQFAVPAAVGDLAAATLAIASVMALHRRWPFAIAMVWVFNLVGFFDLIAAILLRVRFVDTGGLGAAFFVPALYVPALLVSHVLVFQLLTDVPLRRATGHPS